MPARKCNRNKKVNTFLFFLYVTTLKKIVIEMLTKNSHQVDTSKTKKALKEPYNTLP